MNDQAPHALFLARVVAFAASAHVGHRRRGLAQEPYFNHLAEVAQLVAEATGGRDINVIAAAYLHDTVEDVGVTADQLRAAFNDDVAALVLEVTDDKALPKAERKRLQVVNAPHKSERAKLIKLADKTSNLRALVLSPPDWPLERRQEYVDWARAVAAGLFGVNAALEELFFEAAGNADKAIRSLSSP
ncbi:MAG: bifunctional (p)ppGpp synthetase/guanosine-3',5'-bis(diphosphate) 3'-pyrophosphohydrolase [Alphaproteobacteria bacterium]|nr:bifunctional (p)ppGpp synthetase/guanosine-3',5'-bis(diphosphate) 3'-pyrophosphohydrolase [Alphaproteobacteria bacterium]